MSSYACGNSYCYDQGSASGAIVFLLFFILILAFLVSTHPECKWWGGVVYAQPAQSKQKVELDVADGQVVNRNGSDV